MFYSTKKDNEIYILKKNTYYIIFFYVFKIFLKKETSYI